MGNALASSSYINVYLKLRPNNEVNNLISHFNQFLEQHKLFEEYQIAPFINNYPLHITLYLAHYDKQNTNTVINRAISLARETAAMPITTEQFVPSPNGYVSLTVQNQNALQQLSNRTLLLLSDLRDPQAKIPVWAAKNKLRQQLFKQYGSPNVLELYKPHFSVFDPEGLSPEEQKGLYPMLQQLISQFTKVNNTRVTAEAYAIGVGEADEQGQIVSELVEYQLR